PPSRLLSAPAATSIDTRSLHDALPISPRQETSWPAYLGTPRHDVGVAESLNADPRPLWHTGVGRAVRGSPALGESVIVVGVADRSEEHTSELQSRRDLVCRLLLEKNKK